MPPSIPPPKKSQEASNNATSSCFLLRISAGATVVVRAKRAACCGIVPATSLVFQVMHVGRTPCVTPSLSRPLALPKIWIEEHNKLLPLGPVCAPGRSSQTALPSKARALTEKPAGWLTKRKETTQALSATIHSARCEGRQQSHDDPKMKRFTHTYMWARPWLRLWHVYMQHAV